MCDFVSWIEYKDMVFFLQNSDLRTKQGKKLLLPEYIDDLQGHGAIRHYYPELGSKGVDRECTDFSNPKNFPNEIVKAIKAGKMSKIGICLGILTQPARAKYEEVEQQARAKYEEVRQPAWAKYEEVRQQARAKYEEVRQPARAKYEEVRQQAWAKYEEVRQQAWAKYEEVEQPAWAKYEEVKQSAWAKYEEVRQQAWAKYEGVRQPAWAKYEEVRQQAFTTIVKEKKNRKKEWK